MASLFKTICPSFVEHRWQFLFETLSWIAPRQQCLAYLKLEELSGGRDDGDGQDAALLSSKSTGVACWFVWRCCPQCGLTEILGTDWARKAVSRLGSTI